MHYFSRMFTDVYLFGGPYTGMKWYALWEYDTNIGNEVGKNEYKWVMKP